jgi:hypothetical protein
LQPRSAFFAVNRLIEAIPHLLVLRVVEQSLNERSEHRLGREVQVERILNETSSPPLDMLFVLGSRLG